jgi:hypothetical protein
MKNILAAIAIFFTMSTAAYAEEIWRPFEKVDTPAKVPTGYQVKGYADYYIAKKDGRVYNVKNRDIGTRWWWFTVQSEGAAS